MGGKDSVGGEEEGGEDMVGCAAVGEEMSEGLLGEEERTNEMVVIGSREQRAERCSVA